MDTPSYEDIQIAEVFALLRAIDDDDIKLGIHLARHGADPLHIPPSSGMLTAYRLIWNLNRRLVAHDEENARQLHEIQGLQGFKAQMIQAMMLLQADVIRLQQRIVALEDGTQ